MKAQVRGLLVAIICVAVLLPLGCSKKGVTIPTAASMDPDALYQTYIMGVPMLHSDFATSGQFDLAVIGLTFNENVYWATTDNASLNMMTSAGQASGYTATIMNVARRVPTLSQIAVQIVMDGSGSMAGSDPDYVRRAAGNLFVSKLKKRNPNNMVAVAEFSDSTGDYYFDQHRDFTAVSDSASIAAAFNVLGANGSTPLYTSIRRGIQHTDSAVSAASYNRSVIAFTDGWENDSYPSDTANGGFNVYTLAQTKGIPVFIVGLGAVDVPSMIRLAGYSGGVFAQASVPNDLKGIFAVVAVSLTQGYNVITCKVNPIPPSGTNLRYVFTMKSADNMYFRYVDFTIP